MKFWKRSSLGDGFYAAKNMGLCMICCRSPFELKVMTVMPTVELRVSWILVHWLRGRKTESVHVSNSLSLANT